MRPEKQSLVDEIRRDLSESDFVILTDYQGLKVEQTNDLRQRLGKVQARLKVVKNRLFRRVVRESTYPEIEQSLGGPSAMVFGRGDVVETARILKKFVQENERPAIKAGALNGALITGADIQELADLPPRPMLYARLVGTLAAPMTQLVGVMQQKVASLLYVLKAAQEKKEKSG